MALYNSLAELQYLQFDISHSFAAAPTLRIRQSGWGEPGGGWGGASWTAVGVVIGVGVAVTGAAMAMTSCGAGGGVLAITSVIDLILVVTVDVLETLALPLASSSPLRSQILAA